MVHTPHRLSDPVKLQACKRLNAIAVATLVQISLGTTNLAGNCRQWMTGSMLMPEALVTQAVLMVPAALLRRRLHRRVPTLSWLRAASLKIVSMICAYAASMCVQQVWRRRAH